MPIQTFEYVTNTERMENRDIMAALRVARLQNADLRDQVRTMALFIKAAGASGPIIRECQTCGTALTAIGGYFACGLCCDLYEIKETLLLVGEVDPRLVAGEGDRP